MTLDEYILNHSDEEGALLSALNRDANVNLLRPRMLSGHLQGRILKMFCRMLRPRRVLEIGTYTGYATLCLAEGTEDDALIHTLEINDEMEDFIMKFHSRSPLKHSTWYLSMPTNACIPTITIWYFPKCVREA